MDINTIEFSALMKNIDPDVEVRMYAKDNYQNHYFIIEFTSKNEYAYIFYNYTDEPPYEAFKFEKITDAMFHLSGRFLIDHAFDEEDRGREQENLIKLCENYNYSHI